jgi:SWI/SNF-related matrix-associated actin-dependent regulator of chromatin subfamily A member 5
MEEPDPSSPTQPPISVEESSAKKSEKGKEKVTDTDGGDGGEEQGVEVTKKETKEEEEARLREIRKRDKERLRALRNQQKEQLREAIETQNRLVEAEEDNAKKDRFKFLLKQTEIFSHFMKGGPATKGKETGKGKARKRGRKTEKEEDDEILKETLDDEENSHTAGNERLTTTPPWIKGKMRDYQIHGLNWLVKLYDNGINGILADEMGLGKTLQTISLLGYLKHERGLKGPHMVIAPKSTLSNWMNEFARWCPTISVLKFHGNQEEREEIKEKKLVAGKFEVVVTTYEIAIREKSAFKKFSWRYIIIDEAHRIKNEKSVLSQVVRLYKSQNRLLLTGTPLQNNLHELWALLNFLLPDVFSSSEDFDCWFDLSKEDGSKNQEEIVGKLHAVLKPFLLRRLKADVERNLPPKREIKLYVGMSKMQKEWYTKILSRDIEAINGIVKGSGARVRLLNIVMQLRKACNHPYLFDGAEPGPPYVEGEHLITNSGKLVVLDKLLPKLKKQGSRVLIFSQMTRLLDILEDYLLFRNYSYRRIDGSTSSPDRSQAIDEFNAPKSEIFIFLLSTRAGGLGINLATADTVVLYDSDWNPQVDLQAQDRAHRIGQTKPVTVFRFVTEGAIEEKIVERAEAKLHLDALVIRQGQLVEKNKTLDREELLSMIRFGADQIFKSQDSTITDEDIDLIISRGAEKTEQLNSKLKESCLSLLNFAEEAEGSLYTFQGIDYSRGKRKGGGARLPWIEPPARARKTNYSVDNYYREVLRTTDKPKKAPRAPKQPVIHDFQFHPPRLQELLNKEFNAYRAKLDWQRKKQEDKDQARLESKAKEPREALPEPPAPSAPDAPAAVAAAAAASTPDATAAAGPSTAAAAAEPEEEAPDFGELTAEEVDEKEALLSQGFNDWTKRDFTTFVKACERFGRWNLDDIAQAMPDKTKDEIKRYAAVFWKKGKDSLADWERIIANIEKGESKLKRREEMAEALARKVARYKNPWTQLKIAYGPNKGKAYTPEEDQFIICMTHRLGYGQWERLKAEIRRSWQFRFDWFLKSRTPLELSRRCDALIRMIEKENQDLEAKQRAAATKVCPLPAPRPSQHVHFLLTQSRRGRSGGPQ